MDFVELDRRFLQVKKQAGSEEEAMDSYAQALAAYRLGLTLTWDDVLKHRRVVILGEPGSGKTREFEERAKLLSCHRQFGFFVPLEQLVTKPIESVLGPEVYARFQRWRTSSDEAVFFLDSVDERKQISKT